MYDSRSGGVATTTTLDPGDGYLEVWLINRDGKRMVSVGVLDAGAGTFPISQMNPGMKSRNSKGARQPPK